MTSTYAIILAAGDGTRMKSKKSKVLCEVLFKPMIKWSLSALQESGVEKVCAVVAEAGNDVSAILSEEVSIAVQSERLGTGHAVKCAEEFLNASSTGDVLIMCGDSPFMDSQTINAAYKTHKESGNTVTIISARVASPHGYGRIVYDDGRFSKIVEQSECSEEEKLIDEINSGTYWFKGSEILNLLSLIKNDNAKGEYYLTDTIEIAVNKGLKAGVHTAENPNVVLGANDRSALATLNEIARKNVFRALYAKGVDIPVTDGVIISPDAQIGMDTQILPGTIIKGKTIIGESCVIGPNSVIENCEIGNSSNIKSSVLSSSTVGDNVNLGPFAQLRPGSVLADNVKVGNFVEIKNSRLGKGTSVAHLSYFGDAKLGEKVNIGCGVVTANYDGANKHETIIEDGVFVGCNTNFIAPVTVGRGANIGAGSTISKDVPPFALGIERAVQRNIENWAKAKGKYKKITD